MTSAFSGRPPADVTLDALARDELGPDDVRISAETLQHQADVAQSTGNPQLSANLLRAAELTALDESQVMALYEALRPNRSTADELSELAQRLDAVAAPRCAALVREAAEVYGRRGLLT